MQFLRQSTAQTALIGPFVDDTDGKTAETALTISQADIRLSKAGGAFAQSNNSAGATHGENGYYSVPLDATDTNTVGRLRVAISESGALPVWQDFMVLTADAWAKQMYGRLPRTWFLDASATGDASGYTQGNAFTTWAAANTASAKGDTIYVAEGTYAGFNSCKTGVSVIGLGSPAATIMQPAFGFVPGARAIIEGLRIDSTNDSDSAIVGGGADFVTVRRCIVNGKADAILNAGGHFWVVQHCELYGTWDSCNFGDSMGCLIEHCLLSTNCTNIGLATDYRALLIGDQSATTVAGSKLWNTVRHCRIEAIKTDAGSTGKVLGVAAGGRLRLIGCDVVARSTHASYDQAVRALTDVDTETVDTECELHVEGGSLQTSKAHASADDKAVSFVYAASRAELVGVKYDTAKVGATGTVRSRLPDAAPGAASGVLVVGSNAATTFSTLTSTGEFTVNGTTMGASLAAAAADAAELNDTKLTTARANVLTDWIDGGRLDLIADAILADTGTDGVKLDLTQAVPASNTANAIGDCLNSARAQAVGKWVLNASTRELTIYSSDGVTAIAVLDVGPNLANPLTRTPQ